MKNLAVRTYEDEQMDDPALDPATYERVLHDLSRVNAWTWGTRPTLAFLARATKGLNRFRLLDVGFGHGDMLRRIAAWAKKRSLEAELIGIDLNAKSAAIAKAATPAEMNIDYRAGDYRDVAEPLDFVVSSAVTHHMSDAQIHDFLRFMEDRARRGWLVSDIYRGAFAYHGFPLLCAIMGWHRMIREDGQLSIARGFREDDWEKLVRDSGIDPTAAKIARRFPFRLCVERLR